MGRFWNLQTKFVVVLMLLLLGSFGVQTYVHGINEARLLDEVRTINEELAEEVTQRVAERSLTLVQTQFHVKIPIEEIRKSIPRVKLYKQGHEYRLQINKSEFEAALMKSLRKIMKLAREQMEEEARTLALIEQPMMGLERDPDGVARARQGDRLPGNLAGNFARPLTSTEVSPVSATGESQRSFDSGDDGLSDLNEKFDPTLTIFDTTAPLDSATGAVGASAAGNSAAENSAAGNSAAGNSAAGNSGAGSSGAGNRSAGVGAIDSLFADDPIEMSHYTQRFQTLLAEYRRHDLLATVGIFLMGIAFAWLLGVRMTKPVYEMVDGFQSVSQGDLDVQVPEKITGEFGLLGRQFNEMVARLRESRQLQRELEQRERVQLMGDLAAGVAHDVRNPLNAIHLNIGQIRDEFLPDDERARERFVRFTSDVQTEVDRLNQLVTNFLSLARPTSEDLVPTEPNQLLADLMRLISKEAAGRSVQVESELSENLPVLMWNRQEMMSAFLNVAINGLQSMDPDGGTLSIQSTLREAADHDPDGHRTVCVSFVDSGRGIDADSLDKVFIPYYTTRKGGTGLGMAIARRVAERNGGNIEVSSREGEGTSVTFLFPVEGSEELLRERTLAS